MEEGLRQLACFQLQKAARTFELLAEELEGGDGEATMLWGEALFWRGIISEDKGDLKAAIAKLQEAVDLADRKIRAAKARSPQGLPRFKRILPFKQSRTLPDGPQSGKQHTLHECVTRAHCHLLQALLLFRMGTASSYVSGAVKLKSSWKAYQQLYKDEVIPSKGPQEQSSAAALVSADQGDILYGIGGFHFFVSLVPPFLRWIVEALGFKGDRNASQPNLYECIRAGGNRVYAAYLLLIWQDTFFYKERERAEGLFQEATARFEGRGSHSPLFCYVGGYLARVQGNLPLALERFKDAHAACSEVRSFQLMCQYEIGWCKYLDGDYSGAVDHFVPFLAEFRSPSNRAFCAYQLGSSFDLLGRKAEAMGAMMSVAGYVRKHYTFDQYAARRARLYIKRGGMSDFDRAIIPVHNRIEAKDFRAALRLLHVARCHVLSGAPQTVAPGGSGNESSTRTNDPPVKISGGNRDGESKGSIRHAAATHGLEHTGISQQHAPLESMASGGQDKEPVEPPGTVAVVDDVSAVYMMCLAQALVGAKRDDSALECYKAVLDSKKEIKEELYVVPYSLVGVGEIYQRNGDLTAAKDAFRVAKKGYSGYDFDKPLIRRVEHAMGLLKEAEKVGTLNGTRLGI